jgi:hypothetical protein
MGVTTHQINRFGGHQRIKWKLGASIPHLSSMESLANWRTRIMDPRQRTPSLTRVFK